MSIGHVRSVAAGAMAQEASFSISWPGCGVMVFWQLGVLKGLSRHVDPASVPMLGSSSGALVIALAACGVAPQHAVEEAWRLLGCRSLQKRRLLGLFGALGTVTRTWLDNCLPHDAGARLSRRSTILVTQLPLLRTAHITSFESKQDVLDVAMASAHLPLLLDGNWYALCRKRPVIDGGFWWWWQRCDKPYRIPGGKTPPPPPSLLRRAGASTAAAPSYDILSATAYEETSATASPAYATLTCGGPNQGSTAPPASPPVGPPPPPKHAQLPQSWSTQPKPPVSYSSPTSFLDFIAADVQRFTALDQGLDAAATAAGFSGGGGGSSSNTARCRASSRHAESAQSNHEWHDSAAFTARGGGVPSTHGWRHAIVLAPAPHPSPFILPPPSSLSLAAISCASAAVQGAGHGTGHLHSVALGAAASIGFAPPPPCLSRCNDPSSVRSSGARPHVDIGACSGGGDGDPKILLVQPLDDDALTDDWRRYRRWRADDMTPALEMMRHGEAYGSGPLLRRLESLMA